MILLGYCLSYAASAVPYPTIDFPGKHLSGINKTETIVMQVQDVLGRVVVRQNILLKGTNIVRLNTDNVSSGVYISSVISDEYSASVKFLIP